MTNHPTTRRRVKPPKNPEWVAFGRRIKALREAQGLHGYQVAQLISVNPATISQLENGQRPDGPKRATLAKLAGLFGVSIDSLGGPPAAVKDHTHHHDTADRSLASDRSLTTDADPDRGSPGSPPADAATLTRAEIRAAVYDALLALATDVMELIAVATRERATADDPREIRGRDAVAAAQRTHRH